MSERLLGLKSKHIKYVYWKRVIEMRTASDLTFIKDKFLALFGAATEGRSILGMKYVARMWKNT
jgi:hypothetical protein